MGNKRTQDFAEREAEQVGTLGLQDQHSGEFLNFLFILHIPDWVWAVLHPENANGYTGKKKGRE